MIQRLLLSFGQPGAPPPPDANTELNRTPSAWRGIEQKLQVPNVPPLRNGAGTGWSVIQNSGQAPCVPVVSLVMSKATVPVRLVKSNGCFGYNAIAVTLKLSKTLWRIAPLQTMTSFSGCVRKLPLHPTIVDADHALYPPWPGLFTPVSRETPHNTPSSWPERFVWGWGWSNVSQKTAG